MLEIQKYRVDSNGKILTQKVFYGDIDDINFTAKTYKWIYQKINTMFREGKIRVCIPNLELIRSMIIMNFIDKNSYFVDTPDSVRNEIYKKLLIDEDDIEIYKIAMKQVEEARKEWASKHDKEEK